MSGRGRRGRALRPGGGRDVPGQARQPGPGPYRRHHAVRADEDGQRRVGGQGAQAGGRCVAGETDVDPAGVLLGARSWGRAGPGVR